MGVLEELELAQVEINSRRPGPPCPVCEWLTGAPSRADFDAGMHIVGPSAILEVMSKYGFIGNLSAIKRHRRHA